MNSIRMASKKLPIIVIIGATGCGKSKLAIELAKVFDGEVISADSMQVYKGLDIITNKVTIEEQQGVPHHLLDFVNPLKKFTVTDFSNLALPLIDKILANKKIPVIVGGTNYYIESLLWKVLISEASITDFCCKNEYEETISLKERVNQSTLKINSTTNNKYLNSFNNNLPKDENYDIQKVQEILQVPVSSENLIKFSSQQLHDILKKIDFKMANRLHPNDKRKIIRSLQIYQQYGRTHSEIIDEQCAQTGGSSLGGPLRFKNTCILYLQCDQNVLNDRLDSRVDHMIKIGLVKELQDFYEDYKKYCISNNMLPDYTHGIFQSIGFKEFHEFLMLPTDQKQTELGKQLFEKGLTSMKIATKRYSKKQLKWIINRFLKKDRDVPPVYGLQASDLNKWQEVLNSAITIIDTLINDHGTFIEPLPVQEKDENVKQLFFCNDCQKTVIGTLIWEKHLKSRKHKKMRKHHFSLKT